MIQSSPWCSLTAVLFLVLSPNFNAAAQEGNPNLPPAEVERDADILSIGLDLIPSPSGGDFLDGYASLGPDRVSLPALVLPRFMLRMMLWSDVRITFGAAYGRLNFTDIYGVVDSTAPVGAEAYGSFVDHVEVRAVPITVGLEYAPVRTQFTTYVGGVVGLAPARVEWITTTQHESPGELYRPELNVSGVGTELVGRLYAGIDYRFDAAVRERGTFRGIYLEASYLAVPVRRDFFAPVRRQGRGITTPPSLDAATLDLGGVVLTFGVNLQFRRQ